jgi:hypothetical protein
VDAQDAQRVELSVSDQAELGSLREWLSWTPQADVTQVAGKPGAGEQGALDTLALLGSSGALLAAIRVLPEFLRSRRTRLSIKMIVKGKPFTLEASNVDEVMPILERLLDV